MKVEHHIDSHFLGVVKVCTDKTGTKLASSSLDSHVKIYDFQGTILRDIDASPIESFSITFGPTGTLIATCGQGGNVNIFEVDTGKKLQVLQTESKFVHAIAWSSDGKFIAASGGDGSITIFKNTNDNNFRKEHSIKDGHAMTVRSISFSQNSDILFSASDDTQIKMFDVKNNFTSIGSFTGHSSWVLSVNPNPNGNTFATGSSDKTVKIWDIGKRQCLHTFTENEDQVWSVCYNSTGNQLVSASDDKSLCVFNI